MIVNPRRAIGKRGCDARRTIRTGHDGDGDAAGDDARRSATGDAVRANSRAPRRERLRPSRAAAASIASIARLRRRPRRAPRRGRRRRRARRPSRQWTPRLLHRRLRSSSSRPHAASRGSPRVAARNTPPRRAPRVAQPRRRRLAPAARNTPPRPRRERRPRPRPRSRRRARRDTRRGRASLRRRRRGRSPPSRARRAPSSAAPGCTQRVNSRRRSAAAAASVSVSVASVGSQSAIAGAMTRAFPFLLPSRSRRASRPRRRRRAARRRIRPPWRRRPSATSRNVFHDVRFCSTQHERRVIRRVVRDAALARETHRRPPPASFSASTPRERVPVRFVTAHLEAFRVPHVRLELSRRARRSPRDRRRRRTRRRRASRRRATRRRRRLHRLRRLQFSPPPRARRRRPIARAAAPAAASPRGTTARPRRIAA